MAKTKVQGQVLSALALQFQLQGHVPNTDGNAKGFLGILWGCYGVVGFKTFHAYICAFRSWGSVLWVWSLKLTVFFFFFLGGGGEVGVEDWLGF